MNLLYAKTVLYVYPCVEKVAEQIDLLVEKKALSSMVDFSPCIEQCEKIINFTEQKKTLFLLKAKCDEIFSKLTKDELDCLDYKFFKKNPKSYYENFDFTSRAYFRKQNKIIKKVACLLEKKGIDDLAFCKKYCSIDFIKEVYRRVKVREENFLTKKKTTKIVLSKTA